MQGARRNGGSLSYPPELWTSYEQCIVWHAVAQPTKLTPLCTEDNLSVELQRLSWKWQRMEKMTIGCKIQTNDSFLLRYLNVRRTCIQHALCVHRYQRNSCRRRLAWKRGRTICLWYPCTMARSCLSIYDIVSDDDKDRLRRWHCLLLLTSYSLTLWSSHQNFLCNGSSRNGRRLFIAASWGRGRSSIAQFHQHAVMLLPRTLALTFSPSL